MYSTNYAIPSLAVSSGGRATLESTSTNRMTDVKGQGAVGSGASEHYKAGLGVAYGVGEGVTGWREDYYVRDLRIYRRGLNIELAWRPDAATPPGTRFYVYRLAGPFTNSFESWSDGITIEGGIPVMLMSWADSDQVGDTYVSEPEIYYRVSSSANKSLIQGMVPMGKFNFVCEYGDNLVSFPFLRYWADSTALSENSAATVIGGQLQGGDSRTADFVYHKKTAAGFGYDAMFPDSGGVWRVSAGTAFSISPDAGYYIRCKDRWVTVTVAGQLTFEARVHLDQGDNLIGSSFSRSIPLQLSGYSETGYKGDSRTADTVYKKGSPAGFDYDGAFLAGDGVWYDLKTSAVSTMEIGPPNGYFYRRKTSAPADVRRIFR
jgi:hypothetical protein